MKYETEISVDYAVPILSIAVSGISFNVGLANFNLRNILHRDPTFLELLKFMLIEQITYNSTFLVHFRLFGIFIKFAFLYSMAFYGGITIYILSSLILPKIINSLFKIFKFSIQFEPHMILFFPNLISSCYKNCQHISEYHFYRKCQLIYSLLMSMIAIILFRMRSVIFSKFMLICTNQKDHEIMFKLHYFLYALVSISALFFIIEIVCIHFGISFLDWAFKKACFESSYSDLHEVCVRYNNFIYFCDNDSNASIQRVHERRNTI